MSFTAIECQTFAAHCGAIREALTHNPEKDPPLDHDCFDCCASLVHEIGPFVMPIIADFIITNDLVLDHLEPKKLDKLITLLEKLEEELQDCCHSGIPPGLNFRQIIAALLQDLGPILMQLIIGFLLEPSPKKRRKFSAIN